MISIKVVECIFYIIVSGILCCVVHEGSHFLMAKYFGETIKFEFTFGYLFNKIPVPRGIWEMPMKFSSFEKKVVAGAGFTGEFLFSIILYMLIQKMFIFYIVVAILHISAYSFYAGDASDFKWFKD